MMDWEQLQTWMDRLSPDELGLRAMVAIGAPTVLVVSVAFAILVQSWIDSARRAVRVGRATHRVTLKLLSLRPVQGMLTLVLTVLVPVGQIFLVALFFLIGNYVSVLLHPPRLDLIESSVSEHGWGTLQPRILSQLFVADPVSLAYPALGLVCIGLSYYSMAKGDDSLVEVSALLLGAPGLLVMGAAWLATIVMGILAAVVLCFNILLSFITDWLYWQLCRGVLLSSGRLFESWRPSGAGPTTG